MLKLILLVTLVGSLNCVLTNPTTSEEIFTYENASSTSNESSNSSSSQFSESSSSDSSNVNDSENTGSYECSEDVEEPTTVPEQPTTTPEQPTTKPEQPTTAPEQPTTKPEQPTTEPEQPTTTPEEPTTTPNQPNNSSNGITNFDKGNSIYTSKFFNYIVQANPGKSVIMSPYSTLFLMALLLDFSQGQTKDELMSLLNFKSKDEMSVTIPAILDLISEQKNVTLTLAAKIFGSTKSEFSDRFKEESKKLIRAESQNIDFTNGQEAADIINKWVADNTNNKIKDLVSADLIKPDTKMVMANAIYFLGEWRNKFDKDATVSSEFYKSDNTTVMVDTMKQVKYFKYAALDDLNAQALELPYVNENLTCLVLLPKDRDGAASLVSKLADNDLLSSIRSGLQYERVAISLPKYKTATSIDLKAVLKKVGVTSIFEPETSRLEGILANGQNMLVTAAIQKATIDVDESGSEAAAANAIIGVAATAVISEPDPIPFIANHCFIYYLLLQGNPIFCGLYAAILGIRRSPMMPSPPIPFIANHCFMYYLLYLGTPIFCGLYAGN